jgi:hypothetical protein
VNRIAQEKRVTSALPARRQRLYQKLLSTTLGPRRERGHPQRTPAQSWRQTLPGCERGCLVLHPDEQRSMILRSSGPPHIVEGNVEHTLSPSIVHRCCKGRELEPLRHSSKFAALDIINAVCDMNAPRNGGRDISVAMPTFCSLSALDARFRQIASLGKASALV